MVKMGRQSLQHYMKT